MYLSLSLSIYIYIYIYIYTWKSSLGGRRASATTDCEGSLGAPEEDGQSWELGLGLCHAVHYSIV